MHVTCTIVRCMCTLLQYASAAPLCTLGGGRINNVLSFFKMFYIIPAKKRNHRKVETLELTYELSACYSRLCCVAVLRAAEEVCVRHSRCLVSEALAAGRGAPVVVHRLLRGTIVRNRLATMHSSNSNNDVGDPTYRLNGETGR